MEADPSNKTDLHSLAVLLFYMLFMGHPLSGKKILTIRCWDRPSREKLYGKEPVFIFNPQDSSNQAVDLSHDPTGEAGGNALNYWEMYPQAFRNVVTKAFTVGISDPESRVTELEWLTALSALRDSIFKCGSCGASNFYDSETIKETENSLQGPCRKCQKELVLPFRIRIGRKTTMLNAETKLYQHHLDGKHDFSKAVAEVSRHPTDPNIWGLKNTSGQKWTATMADGSFKDVEVGRSVPLASGVKVQFEGNIEGEIRY